MNVPLSFSCLQSECARLSWVELSSTDTPPLELPESSKDIPIPVEYLLDTVELYELLRSYWRTLRLTPFLFEDFCAALLSSDNSCLLSEIHIVLIRMCFKNDDEEQVHFSGNETNNAYNIVTACLEPMTYAEVLRQYLSSDTTVPSEVMEAVNAPNYPFVGFSARLVLITFLSYRFLYSTEYKKLVVASNGKIEVGVCSGTRRRVDPAVRMGNYCNVIPVKRFFIPLVLS
ncbi:DDT domain protein [Ancylostoma duodenale]|uniref:DDT domain protein n=1 Tax=Ancylostoma duodenale TaxID=51022 RepID=A0A0C2D5V2_9BILA|nr:DDT domain protein [Ancylostoma duodenale]